MTIPIILNTKYINQIGIITKRIISKIKKADLTINIIIFSIKMVGQGEYRGDTPSCPGGSMLGQSR